MNNNNNKDTIKVKYLTLTRLKAEYSNRLIIIVGYAILNQQLHWEHARDLTLKYQGKKQRRKSENQRKGRKQCIQSKYCMYYCKSSTFSYRCHA